MSKEDELRKELADLKAERERDNSIKKLEQQIKAEKFAQSKTGKFVNAVGKYGEKITRPKPVDKSKPKKKSKPKSIQEVMDSLPQ